MASTAPVRVSEDMLADVQKIAAMRGESPGELLGVAWTEFLDNHRAELAESFDAVAKMLREGDTQGLMEHSRPARRARAAAAAARAAS